MSRPDIVATIRCDFPGIAGGVLANDSLLVRDKDEEGDGRYTLYREVSADDAVRFLAADVEVVYVDEKDDERKCEATDHGPLKLVRTKPPVRKAKGATA